MSDEPILEEHSVVEPKGMIGGKKIDAGVDGKLRKTTFVVACDSCGKYPLNEFVICKSCRGKLCDDCLTKLDGRPYCHPCLIELLPVTANGFKILVCVESGLDSLSAISDHTRISKEDVRTTLKHLAALKLVKTKGLLAFATRKLTADGIRVLAAYAKFYDKDEDVKELKSRMEEKPNGD